MEEINNPTSTKEHIETQAHVKETPYHPIFPGSEFENVESKTVVMPTLVIVGILILVFIFLKIFIYDKDEKKHEQ
jgi:hypothetical protein